MYDAIFRGKVGSAGSLLLGIPRGSMMVFSLELFFLMMDLGSQVVLPGGT